MIALGDNQFSVELAQDKCSNVRTHGQEAFGVTDRHEISSRIVALAWPPPSHIVCSP